MSAQHPLTPPEELVQQWAKHILTPEEGCLTLDLDWFANQAAQWGADQELEACLVEASFLASRSLADRIRAARRPKPPTLKEQALAALGEMSIEPCLINGVDANAAVRAKYNTVRRALEALDD